MRLADAELHGGQHGYIVQPAAKAGGWHELRHFRRYKLPADGVRFRTDPQSDRWGVLVQ